MSTNDFHSLFALRHPFTALYLRHMDDFVDIAIDISGEYAGTLCVPTDNLGDVLLQAFAEGRREVGFLDRGGRVTWHVEPQNLSHVIDDRGRLHDVAKLER